MSRKRAAGVRSSASEADRADEMGPRIAVAYLVAVLASVATGLVVAIGMPVADAACKTADDLTCNVSWYANIAIPASLVAMVIGARIAKLGWWFAIAVCAAMVGALLLTDVSLLAGLIAALLAPLAGVLASQPWKGSLPPWQRWGLGGLGVLAVAALIWWRWF